MRVRNRLTASTPQPELRQQQPSAFAVLRPRLLAARGLLPAGAPSSRGLLLRRGLATGLLRRGLLRRALRPLPSCDRPSSLRRAFFGAASCGRPSSRRPSCGRRHASPAPARVAVRWLVFLRCSPAGNSFCRVVGCSRAVEPRPGRRSRVAWSSATHANAAHARKRDEPARRTSAPSSSSHLRFRIRRRCSIDCASPGRGLRSMDRPSVAVRTASTAANRIAHAPNPLFLVSPMAVNKKQPFRRNSMKKMRARCNAMHRCHSKTAATSLSRRCVQRQRIAQPRLSIGTNARFSGPV